MPIRKMILLAALLAPGMAHADSDNDESRRWAADAKRLAQPLIDADIVPSLVVGLYSEGHREVYGFGSISKQEKKAPNGKTLFEIGSITKVFTGILLAEALRREELKLDDPLAKFVPEGSTAPVYGEQKQPITLLNLATHRSSLPRIPSNMAAADSDPYANYDATKLFAFLSDYPLTNPPGSKFQYSNLGMGLLGHILATEQKTDYHTLLTDRIATPLGLTDTVVKLTAEQKQRFATPHRNGKAVQPWEFQALCGCGGIRSTVDDLLKFIEQHMNVEESALAEALPLAMKRQAERMGLGWFIAGDAVTYFHNGQTGGFSSGLFLSPGVKHGAVVLANGASGKVDVLAERLIQLLFGMDVDPPEIRKRLNLPTEQLQKLVGTYPSQAGFTITISVHRGDLYAQLTGQTAFRVFAETPTKFFYDGVDAELVFDLAKDAAQATAVTLLQNGLELRCERAATKTE